MIVSNEELSKVNPIVWDDIIRSLALCYNSISSSRPGEIVIPDNAVNDNDEIIFKINNAIHRLYRGSYSHWAKGSNASINLPMIEKDYITQWQDVAYVTSILKANNLIELYMNFFVELRMHWNKDSDQDADNYHGSKYIITSSDAYTVLNNYFDYTRYDYSDNYMESPPSDIIAYIKSSINRNRYIALMMDEYYMPNHSSYRRQHTFLRMLVFGYNDTSNTVKYISYNLHRLFSIGILSYNDCIEGFENNKLFNDDGYSYMEEYSLLDEAYNYHFCPIAFREKLIDYYRSLPSNIDTQINASKHGCTSSDNHIAGNDLVGSSFNHATGMMIYDLLFSFIEEDCKSQRIPIYQNIHAMHEHKKLLLERVLYINDNYRQMPNEILQKVNDLVIFSNNARMAILKLKRSKRPTVRMSINDVVTNLSRCQAIEYDIIPKLITLLE